VAACGNSILLGASRGLSTLLEIILRSQPTAPGESSGSGSADKLWFGAAQGTAPQCGCPLPRGVLHFTYLFDMTDLDKPVALPPYDAKTNACDHNEYVVGTFLHQAN
jgi:hypothetical protein